MRKIGDKSFLKRILKIKSDKKGMDYYILLSLILGLMILAIVLFWIYQEYFTADDVDIQLCRQSIELRANLPDAEVAEFKLTQFKEKFPLKCRTEVVNIDYEDVERLEKEIAHTIAGCWSLYGEGNYAIFPRNVYSGIGSSCVPCGRIHINSHVKEYYLDKEISIAEGLTQQFRDTSYLGFLTQGDGPFSALSFGNARPFNLKGEEFLIDQDDTLSVKLVNRVTGRKHVSNFFGIDLPRVDLPEFYDPTKGDLLIFYGSTARRSTDTIGPYIPYMFYAHSNSNYQSYFDDLVLNGPLFYGNGELCHSLEGIPA